MFQFCLSFKSSFTTEFDDKLKTTTATTKIKIDVRIKFSHNSLRSEIAVEGSEPKSVVIGDPWYLILR